MNGQAVKDREERAGAPIAELVRSAVAGDEGAWETIIDAYGGLIWRVACTHGLSEGEAADVVHTTWLRLVQRLTRMRDPEPVDAWLVTTARREALRALRLAGREHVADVEDMDRHDPDRRRFPRYGCSGEVARIGDS